MRVENYDHVVDGGLTIFKPSPQNGPNAWEVMTFSTPDSKTVQDSAPHTPATSFHSTYQFLLPDWQYKVLYSLTGYAIRNGVEDDNASAELTAESPFTIMGMIVEGTGGPAPGGGVAPGGG